VALDAQETGCRSLRERETLKQVAVTDEESERWQSWL